MAEKDDKDELEGANHGMLEGSGPGGGASDVRDNRPAEERGGSRLFFYVVVALVIVLAIWPIVWLSGVVAKTTTMSWMYLVTLIIALLIVLPFVYGLIRKST